MRTETVTTRYASPDRVMQIRSVVELDRMERRPSGLSQAERGRLKDLWNITRPTAAEKSEMRALQARMR